MSFSFEIAATTGAARAGIFSTPHGTVETPVFMPVGTLATVKALDPDDLVQMGASMILGNAYHLHLRPGTRSCARWAACIGSCAGTDRFSPTRAASRFSRSPSCAPSPRKRRVPVAHRWLAPFLYPRGRDADRAQPRRRRHHAVRHVIPGSPTKHRRATPASEASAGWRDAWTR